MTGKNPGKHGVFDFIRPRAGTFDMVNARRSRQAAVGNSQRSGLFGGVLNVPSPFRRARSTATWCPVCSRRSRQDRLSADLLKPYEAELGKYRLTPNVQYKAGNEDEFIADLHDLIDTQLRYALRLMQDHPTDVLMLHFSPPITARTRCGVSWIRRIHATIRHSPQVR